MRCSSSAFVAVCLTTLAFAACTASDDDDAGQNNNNNVGNNNNNNGNNNNNNQAPLCVPDAPVCDGTGPNNGCDSGFVCNPRCRCEAEVVIPTDFLPRPSRSTAIDITVDDTVVAMVNSDDGSVSLFNAAEGQESRIAVVQSSNESNESEPVAVVIHPNQSEAYVANRATGSVARIVNIDSAQARLDDEIVLGGEVMGLALTPSGSRLWVTNWTLRTVTVIDTDTFSVQRTIDLPGNPFAIAISNNGDTNDDDEKVVVTDFFARQIPGEPTEAVDSGREGRVWFFDTSGGREREVPLPPIANCFEGKIGDVDVQSGCFINQLYGVTIHSAFGRTYAYVTSVGASPAGPVNFNHNVQAVVSVISLAAEAVRPDLSHNLNTLIATDQIDNDGDDTVGRRFMNVPNAIAFVNRDDVAIGYVTSAASDIVLRVEWAEDDSFSIGAPSAFNIPVGQNPLGIQLRHQTGAVAAYTANLISRDMSVLSFRDQRTVDNIESTSLPRVGTQAFDVWRGKRFFNTSTAIWSKEGWGSCQGCHPMGLTDNVTWSFAAGPRQTIALDGQFASNDPSDMRALNWTAIFDETDDFENNTRGVSGGTGAIRNDNGPLQSLEGARFSALLAEDGQTFENHQALNGSLTFVTANDGICTNENTCPDWRQIDAYIQTIRSPRGRDVDTRLIDQGRTLFQDGGCDKCHAGPKWTISRTFYTPEDFSGDLPNRLFETNRLATVAMNPNTLVGLPQDVNVDTTLIAGDDSNGGAPAFKRQACNVRRVGTFGATGGAEEKRANNGPAQGQNGFNPPSLLGGILGAPFLHNGAAGSMDDMFDQRFDAHTTAGNPNFRLNASDRAALVAFLESIDETTETFDILPNTVLCPQQ